MPHSAEIERGFRSFAPKYDVPQRGRPDIRFSESRGQQQAEAGPTQDEREPFLDLLAHDGFKQAMRLVFIPYIKKVRSALLRNPNLDELQRQRLVGALATVEDIINQIFRQAGVPVPEWLQAQFK